MNDKISKLLSEVNGKSLETIQKEQQQQVQGDAKTADILDTVKSAMANIDTISVNGTEYKIEKYTTTEWLKVTPFLGKQFGVPMAMGLGGMFTEDMSDDNSLGEALFMLFSNLENGGIERVANILLTKVTVAGAPVEIEDFINPYDLIEVCSHVLMLNYNDFFTKGINRIMGELAKVGLVAGTLSHE